MLFQPVGVTSAFGTAQRNGRSQADLPSGLAVAVEELPCAAAAVLPHAFSSRFQASGLCLLRKSRISCGAPCAKESAMAAALRVDRQNAQRLALYLHLEEVISSLLWSHETSTQVCASSTSITFAAQRLLMRLRVAARCMFKCMADHVAAKAGMQKSSPRCYSAHLVDLPRIGAAAQLCNDPVLQTRGEPCGIGMLRAGGCWIGTPMARLAGAVDML